MPSLNKVILMGNLCSDPELKVTPSAVSVTSFTIGVQRRVKDASGQYQSDFINIVAWRQTAEFICKFFRKGKPICIFGSIQTRNYTDQHGNKHYVTEVVADEATFTESKSESPSEQMQPIQPNQNPMATQPAPQIQQHPQQRQMMTPPPVSNTEYTELSEEDDLPF